MGFTTQQGTGPNTGHSNAPPVNDNAGIRSLNASPFMQQAGASPQFAAAAADPGAMQNYWARYQGPPQVQAAMPIPLPAATQGYRQAPVQMQAAPPPNLGGPNYDAVRQQYQQYIGQYPNTASQVSSALPTTAPSPTGGTNDYIGAAVQQYLADNPAAFSGYLGGNGGGGGTGFQPGSFNDLTERGYYASDNHAQGGLVGLPQQAMMGYADGGFVDYGQGYAGGGLAGFEHRGMAGNTPRGYRGARAPGNVRLPGGDVPGGNHARLGTGAVPITGPGGGGQGLVKGPGTGTSDSVHAPKLSNGEFVMTKKAVDGAGKVAAVKGDKSPLGGARLLYGQMRNLEMAATRG